jgi:hypothetical protein
MASLTNLEKLKKPTVTVIRRICVHIYHLQTLQGLIK